MRQKLKRPRGARQLPGQAKGLDTGARTRGRSREQYTQDSTRSRVANRRGDLPKDGEEGGTKHRMPASVIASEPQALDCLFPVSSMCQRQ